MDESTESLKERIFQLEEENRLLKLQIQEMSLLISSTEKLEKSNISANLSDVSPLQKCPSTVLATKFSADNNEQPMHDELDMSPQKDKTLITTTDSQEKKTAGPQISNIPPTGLSTYKKRPGTSDVGKEYEYMMSALYALKFATDDDISDFEMTTNDIKYGNFDDISLKITDTDATRHFLLQLKHKEDSKKHLTEADFTGSKSDFNLVKYMTSFENTDLEDAILILYTNCQTRMKEGNEFVIRSQQGGDKLSLIRARQSELDILDDGDVFQFDVIQNGLGLKKVAQFCKQFYFCANQKNINGVRAKVRQILATLLNQDIFDLFVAFIRNWWLGRFVLTKHDVVAKVAELALKPWTRTLSCEKLNHKSEILANTIMTFQMTIVQDSDIVDKIWAPGLEDKDMVGKAAKKYDVTGNVVWWYLGKVPLVVDVSQENQKQMTCVLKLLEKCITCMKIVLVGKVAASQFPTWNILESYAGVPDMDVTNFKLSLQGREPIKLHHLLTCNPQIAKIVTIKELLQMSQSDLVVGIEEVTKLPEIYIPRTISSQSPTLSVKEDRIFEHFTNQLNIFCALPGMGKSTLFQIMKQKYCPNDCWSVYVPLINYNDFLSFMPSSEEILRIFCKLEYGENFTQKLKKLLLKNGKAHMFLDGVDELETDSQNILLDFIKNMASNNRINVWISSRENVHQKMLKVLNRKPLVIEEVNKKQQRNYIYRRLVEEYNEEELEKIINVVFRSSDITNSGQLLGVPLQLYVITEMFRNNRRAYDSLNDEIFVLTKMYKLFFEGKRKFSYGKIGVDKYDYQLGTHFDHHLKQYEILGLKSSLDRKHFERLGIDQSSYNDFFLQVKENGDKFGIISNIHTNNQIVFNHQTYAEYFACVWFKSNVEKLPLLRYELFSLRYENLKRILDIMMAEKNPLHLAVIYKNMDQFEKHIDDRHKIDQGGRTVVHIACSYGNKFPDEIQYKRAILREDGVYVKMVEILLQDAEISEVDSLFKLNVLDYSLASRCLLPLEKMLEQAKITATSLEKIIPADNFSHYADNLAYYCAQFGYPRLLSAVLQKQLVDIDDQKYGDHGLLGVAVRGCRYDDGCDSSRNGNIAAVEILLKNGAKIKNILQYACQLERYDTLRVLVDSGAKCEEGNTVLHMVVQYGRQLTEEVAKHFCDCVDSLNSQKQTPFQLACSFGSVGSVKRLLDFGANPNRVDAMNRNAMHYAASSHKDNSEVLALLVGRAVDVNAPCSTGTTPLHMACQIGELGNIKKLLEFGANPMLVDLDGLNCLHYAAISPKETKTVFLLFEKLGLTLDMVAQNGQTPLHIAAEFARPVNVRTLLELGADLETVDHDGRSAMHYAAGCWFDNKIAIEELHGHDLDLNIRAKNGETPLHSACEVGNLKHVKLLLNLGGSANEVDDRKRNPLHYAAASSENTEKIIVFLIKECGLDVNSRDIDGQTPLHVASQNDQVANVDCLLEFGADVTTEDNQNKNALYFAVGRWWKNEKVIELLIENGVKINLKDHKGSTPLHVACLEGHLKNVDKLLKMGADVNAVDLEGRSVEDYAILSNRNSAEKVDLLKSYGFGKNNLIKRSVGSSRLNNK